MKTRKALFILFSILLFSAGAYSQNCDCYIQNADSTFRLVPMGLGTDTGGAPYYRCNNCSSIPIKLPFKFCFYGKEYDTVYINNKGTLSFIHPVFNFSSSGFPAGNDTLMLAVCWSDIDNRIVDPFSAIYYKITSTHLIVQWSTVGYNTFDDDLYNNFQVTITNGNDSILSPHNNVSYCYWLMQWASGDSSGGSAGFDGIPATIGVNKGDHVHYAQIGEFNFPGSAYGGPNSPNSGIYWLINKSFLFNTCVNGNSIPPVIIKPNSCNIDTLCTGDAALFTVSFLCPQQGQTATLSASSPGFSGLTSSTTNSNSIYNIKTEVIASLKDTGAHAVYLTATDNNSPPLKDSIAYIIVIKKCFTDTSLGISNLAIGQQKFTVYPNPNNGNFQLEIRNEELGINNTVEVYNVLGEKVYSHYQITKSSNYQINLSSQPAGVYFYLIKDETGKLLGWGKFAIQ